jgi:hypothetical protein
MPAAIAPDDRAAVHVHVHLAMTGSFPLRVADLLFTDGAVVIPEYAHLTPLFGIARGRASDAGETARERYRERALAGLVEMSERTHRLPYDTVDRIRLYRGSITRPKIAVVTAEGPPYAYRIHAPVEVDDLASALEALGDRRGFAVERHAGSGFSPANSLRRFLADR